MKKILIAGATGYLGRHLVLELASRGLDVTAVVRPGKTAPGAARTIEAQITDPSTLKGICDGQDAVFSALGITRQTDAVTYEDIEYQANVDLLNEALSSGVRRFGVISVVAPDAFSGLAITASRERFVHYLQESQADDLVVRSTGFFCDLQEVFEMAEKGRVYLLGDGSPKTNPIDGKDLAVACADALLGDAKEVNVGGPDVFTWNEVASLAFNALEKPEKTTRIPLWCIKALLPLLKPFQRRTFDIGSFILRGASLDTTGPRTGRHSLKNFYRTLARSAKTEAKTTS